MAGLVTLPAAGAWVIVLMLVLATTSAPVKALPNRSESSSVGSTHRVLGYYVPYDPASWATLQTQAHLIDIRRGPVSDH
jgi:hypothetical protein